MHYLIIDTCNWIDLCKKYAKLRGKIADLLAQGRVVLIVPQVVLDEWERNKPYRQLEDSIRGQIKNARAIAQHLPQEEADTLKRILDEFQLSKGEIERVVGTPIQAIDGLLKYHSTVTLEAPDRVKLQAVDLALAKKAPFGSRNGMADALVVLSALDYATEQGLDNCIFVSSNTSDFSSDSDERQIHPDLAPLFEICGMKYYANIGQAINEIETGLVSDDSIEEIEWNLQIAESLGSMLDIPGIREALLESQHRRATSIKSLRDALLESQRQQADSIKSISAAMLLQSQQERADSIKSLRDALLEGQRQQVDSIKSISAAMLLQSQQERADSIKSLRDALLESQRQQADSIKSLRDALLESGRQTITRRMSAVDFSQTTGSIQGSPASPVEARSQGDSNELADEPEQADASSEQE